jgi:flagellar export protein FliJ
MRPFSFRLDSILRYRDYLEKRAQRDLFSAKNEYIERVTAAKRLAEERVETARRCKDGGFKGIDVALYQIYLSFMQGLDNDIERAYISIKKAEGKVKAQEVALRKESIKKKTLELLKELQLKRYLEGLDKEEQKVVDELVIIRKGVRG